MSLAEVGGDAALWRANKRGLGGDVSCLTIGLSARGGVKGRSLGFGPSDLLFFGTVVPLLTSSLPSSPFSNIDIKELVGGIGLESVARSRLVTELAALCPPRLPFRCRLAAC